MKIYKIIKTTKGFLGDYENITWYLDKPENAVLVNSINDCKKYNTRYAIECELEKFSIKDILELLTKDLSFSETMRVCEENKQIKELLMQYIQNPLVSSDFQKKLKEIKEKTDSASGLAAMSLLTNVLD